MLAVYETVAPPGGGEVTAADDDPPDVEPVETPAADRFLPRWLRRGPGA
ncbi:unannotated protein [freshwater metagenome]|uniref:Unannotated protein n=1 Tax=freshwater metagenome TaxID=449393 RepID=A0A6J7HBV2_9ZZZZ